MVNVTPVLIVGAGPVGLTAAAMLNHYGIPVRIIDKKPLPTQTSNAVVIHSRTLELMGMLGLTNQFVAAGRLTKSMEMYSNLSHLASIHFDLIESQYKYLCCVPQNITEKILIEHLTQQGISVERSIELLSINTEMDQTVTVVTDKGTIEANWVVACDGYHSKARESLNIPYEGSDMKLNFMMIDAPVTWDLSLESMYGCFNDQLSLALFPMKNSVRMIAEISHAPQYINTEPNEAVFMKIAEGCVPGSIKIDKPLWSSKFWIHERLAAQYLQGHVLLAGDAAHAHSPTGGQGMNTGLQDAINLAWKLALVVQGEANEKLLLSYQEERRPVAQQVLSVSSFMSEAALTKNRIASTLRTVLMPLISKLNVVQKKAVGFLSETSINYEKSSIVSGHSYQNTHPGDRSAYTDPAPGLKHTVLDFKGDAEKIFSGNKWVQVINAPTLNLAGKLGQLDNVYCILRPDFYIGYLGDNLNEVQNYFQKIKMG